MKISNTPLQDAVIIEPEYFADDRGRFTRIFCQDELRSILNGKNFVQINHVLTIKKGAIRGMHFQYPPKAEIKMVKCISGSVFDVIIDMRNSSPTFLNWHAVTLSAENMKMIFIPEGYAHGLQTLEKNCELLYLHTEFYSPEQESGVRYNDPRIRIQWPLEPTEISYKDERYAFLPQDFEGIHLQ